MNRTAFSPVFLPSVDRADEDRDEAQQEHEAQNLPETKRQSASHSNCPLHLKRRSSYTLVNEARGART